MKQKSFYRQHLELEKFRKQCFKPIQKSRNSLLSKQVEQSKILYSKRILRIFKSFKEREEIGRVHTNDLSDKEEYVRYLEFYKLLNGKQARQLVGLYEWAICEMNTELELEQLKKFEDLYLAFLKFPVYKGTSTEPLSEEECNEFKEWYSYYLMAFCGVDKRWTSGRFW